MIVKWRIAEIMGTNLVLEMHSLPLSSAFLMSQGMIGLGNSVQNHTV